MQVLEILIGFTAKEFKEVQLVYTCIHTYVNVCLLCLSIGTYAYYTAKSCYYRDVPTVYMCMDVHTVYCLLYSMMVFWYVCTVVKSINCHMP